MSLVNDMLRDLEQRNERPASALGNQSSVKAAQFVEADKPNNLPRLFLWVIGVSALLMTAWLLWQDQSSSPAVVNNDVQSAPPVEKTTDQPVIQEVKPAPTGPAIAEPKVEPIEPSRAVITEIKWAGTDQGGDLVVRLDGAADVQVVSQNENVIVIAFDDAILQTAVPRISNHLVKRVDLNTEPDRALLTVTTKLDSQFAFRVQQAPTTLILGVIAKEPSVKPVESVVVTEVVSEKSNSEEQPDATEQVKEVVQKPNGIKSGEELQVAHPNDAMVEKTRPSKPVTKATAKLSDQQSADRARRLINQGKLADAETLLLKSIVGQSSKSLASRRLLATLYLSTNNQSKAERLLSDSLALYPTDVALRKLQARIWLTSGQQAQAVSLLEKDKPAMKQDAEFYELLASAYQQDGNFTKAAQNYYQLLQFNNQVPRWWVGLGYAFEQSQRFQDARNAYRSAMQIPSIDSSLKQYAQQRIQALTGR
ncbi:tetratricopeptide repeat protein [Neptuniibacter sp. SY11_33]|uniref:tetratricopeptide repeat protein n=1 Tax=Neptuniibacter sp. SY11_33 TaxID=3398215 RepID=UPI0039F46E0D